MAKRTRKPAVNYAALTRRKLPLGMPLDPRWRPLRSAVAALTPRYSDPEFAAGVLAEELRMPTISCMRVLNSIGAAGELPKGQMTDEYIWRAWRIVLVGDDVRVDWLSSLEPDPELQEFAFYVWWPDFEKRFGFPQANVQTQEVPETRGRKAFPYPKLAVDLVTWLATTRALAGNKSDRLMADEFEDYCDRNEIEHPKYTQLRAWMAGIKKALFTPPETHKKR